jgi:hypothetical protein
MARNSTPVGYAALIELFKIKAFPHYRNSYILSQGAPYSERVNFEETHYYPPKYFPKDFQNPINHLEFALKYDGINLEILYPVFEKLGPRELVEYIRSRPTSKLARKIWYLYEFLTNQKLDVEDAVGGSYTLLLDANDYYTGIVKRSKRHYVDDNLLGNVNFCPIVRKTETLKKFEEANLAEIAKELLAQYDSTIITRAVNYLYIKETMSSYEIEREKPDVSRAQRFVAVLQKADHIGMISKQMLIDLQNIIVDPRFANKDYRDFQNYIGIQTRLDTSYSTIEYISPKPEDVASLMEGLIESCQRMMKSDVHPVVIAAAISFGFVFIHRFLIHYIFANKGFVPSGAIFPISATILKERAAYDSLLDFFSKPLIALIDKYTIDDHGKLTVFGETAMHYRYLDYTNFVEFLFQCVEKTIQTEFKNELNFIVHFDTVKKAIQEIVDMPDSRIHLFIQLVLQNRGVLSRKKREGLFSRLTDDEIKRMESAVRENML